MKKAKKIVALLLCAILLVGATIAGTVAYLTDTDNEVTNTFSVGKVVITLDEADVDEYGAQLFKTDDEGKPTAEEADRVQTNAYTLVPNRTYKKDPTVHVQSDSEDCYIFVKIENQITALVDADTIENQITAKGWTALSGVDGVYYKEWKKGSTTVDLVVFEKFKIKSDVVADTLNTYAGKTIKVTAYAIQAFGFDSANAAWTAGGFT